jgi:hypothetical protein
MLPATVAACGSSVMLISRCVPLTTSRGTSWLWGDRCRSRARQHTLQEQKGLAQAAAALNLSTKWLRLKLLGNCLATLLSKSFLLQWSKSLHARNNLTRSAV